MVSIFFHVFLLLSTHLVERNAGVGSLVNTGDLDSGTGLASTAGLDLKLVALDVELSLADVTLVEADVLDADEVLSSRDVVLDGPLQPVLLPAVPSCVDTGSAGVLEAALHHLDPVTAAIVRLDGARCLGDVNEAWAGVLDELVVEDLESELVACLDSVGGSVTCGGALVAAKVVAVHQLGGDRWVVGVAVLADVGILATDGLSVDNQAVEDVVSVGSKRRKKREEGDCLDHDEGGMKVGKVKD
jgi:hypothetical protein